jgi:ankyrin repeat protein
MKRMMIVILLFVFRASLSASVEPIVEAAKKGDLRTVKTILEKDPAKLNAVDEEKYTALHWACMRAQWEIAKYLIEKGADLNIKGGDGAPPITWAAHHDNVEIVRSMVERGAELNIKNLWGMTELHTAIWRGNIHVVEYLLDAGSDPAIKTNEGWTAMHYAHRSGHDNVIDLLKRRGIPTNVLDDQNRYPRHLYFKKPKAIVLSNQELDEYTGKYYVGDYLLIEIWREGGKLKVMEYGPDELYPVARDFFYFKQAPWTLIFTRDENGNVHHAQLSFIRRSYTMVRK